VSAGRDPVLIRSMRTDDLEWVMAIAASLPTAPQWPRTAYEAAIDPGAVPRRVRLVAEAGGQPAGFVIASIVGPVTELESIAVVAEDQGQGIGSALMKGLFEELKRASVRELELELRESNRAARRFYERVGFSETGRRPRYYRNPEEDAVLMRFELATRAGYERNSGSAGWK
jgi:[ribosomal protein S18]-alanine N-acetyltransferase